MNDYTKRALCDVLGVSDTTLNHLRQKKKINPKFRVESQKVVFMVHEFELENIKNVIENERREGRLQK